MDPSAAAGRPDRGSVAGHRGEAGSVAGTARTTAAGLRQGGDDDGDDVFDFFCFDLLFSLAGGLSACTWKSRFSRADVSRARENHNFRRHLVLDGWNIRTQNPIPTVRKNRYCPSEWRSQSINWRFTRQAK